MDGCNPTRLDQNATPFENLKIHYVELLIPAQGARASRPFVAGDRIGTTCKSPRVKALFLVFAVSGVLVSRAADVYLSGAWFDTKTASHLARGAGEVRMWLYETNVTKVEFWFNGALLQTGEGTWTEARRSQKKIAVTMPDGRVLKGNVSSFTDFGTGSYRGSDTSGRWQAIRP